MTGDSPGEPRRRGGRGNKPSYSATAATETNVSGSTFNNVEGSQFNTNNTQFISSDESLNNTLVFSATANSRNRTVILRYGIYIEHLTITGGGVAAITAVCILF